MQCISSFNKNSPPSTFNICINSHLRFINSITVFSSTSTRFGISTWRDSGCVELPQRLQLEINCLNGQKTNMIKAALKSFLMLLLFTMTYVQM